MATQVAVGTELNEVKLIRAGQRGDSQAVEALFRRYQRPLFQTAIFHMADAYRDQRRVDAPAQCEVASSHFAR